MKEILKNNPLDIVEVYCPIEICRKRNVERGDRYEHQSDEQALQFRQDFALAAKSVKIRFGREESGTLPKANLKCAGFSYSAAGG